MAGLGLHHLIQAIAGAVAEAQDKIHKFQLKTVGDYFDENFRPRSVPIVLPNLSPNAEEGSERQVLVPLLTLVAPQLLGIKEVQIEFDVALTAVDDEDAAAGKRGEKGSSASANGAEGSTAGAGPNTPDKWRGGGLERVLGVDVGGGRGQGSGALAKVTLKVESMQQSDGMARLIQTLNSTYL